MNTVIIGIGFIATGIMLVGVGFEFKKPKFQYIDEIESERDAFKVVADSCKKDYDNLLQNYNRDVSRCMATLRKETKRNWMFSGVGDNELTPDPFNYEQKEKK